MDIPSANAARRDVAEHGLSGPLSSAHAFLKEDCAACHTPVKGVEDATCVACHANETVLVQRQPTAFHADIAGSNNCVACHKEHDAGRSLRGMDHAALTDIIVRWLDRAPEGHEGAVLLAHLKAHGPRRCRATSRLPTA